MYIFETKSGEKMSCGREPYYDGYIWVLRLLNGVHPEFIIGRFTMKRILKDVLRFKK